MSQFLINLKKRVYLVESDDYDGSVISIHERSHHRMVYVLEPSLELQDLAEQVAARIYVQQNES